MTVEIGVDFFYFFSASVNSGYCFYVSFAMPGLYQSRDYCQKLQ